MTSTSLTDPFRSLMWLAVVAFCVGFAGFLAVNRTTPQLSVAQDAPALAVASLPGDPA